MVSTVLLEVRVDECSLESENNSVPLVIETQFSATEEATLIAINQKLYAVGLSNFGIVCPSHVSSGVTGQCTDVESSPVTLWRRRRSNLLHFLARKRFRTAKSNLQ